MQKLKFYPDRSDSIPPGMIFLIFDGPKNSPTALVLHKNDC